MSTRPKSEYETAAERLYADNWDIPHGCLVGLERLNVFCKIPKKAFLELRHSLRKDYKKLKSLNQAAFKAWLLFDTPQKLEKFGATCQRLTYYDLPLADALDAIKFPPAHTWPHIDFRAWGRAYMVHGTMAVNDLFQRGIHAPSYNKQGKISLLKTEFEWLVSGISPEFEPALKELMSLALQFGKNADEFFRAADCYTEDAHVAEPQTQQESLPDIEIDGHEFGMPGAMFKKLSRHDPRLLFIGDFNKSCERVTDADSNLERTVTHTRHSNISAYYIVEREGRPIAHSWAWRGVFGEMVFDGFESREKNFDMNDLSRLMPAICQHFRHTNNQKTYCNGIFLGKCADHLDGVRKNKRTFHPKDFQPKTLNEIGMDQTDITLFYKPYDEPSYISEGLSKWHPLTYYTP
ncbi:MAG: hypothetical protein J0L77_00450 [Alphaproteobacteria bacterium]|nr:hypothetical protein [Alphaproteobacteria bacterium]